MLLQLIFDQSLLRRLFAKDNNLCAERLTLSVEQRGILDLEEEHSTLESEVEYLQKDLDSLKTELHKTNNLLNEHKK